MGDTAELRGAGVEPTHHLPGVGRNLQDHLEIYMVQACTQPVSLLSDQGGLRMIKVLILRYIIHYRMERLYISMRPLDPYCHESSSL